MGLDPLFWIRLRLILFFSLWIQIRTCLISYRDDCNANQCIYAHHWPVWAPRPVSGRTSRQTRAGPSAPRGNPTTAPLWPHTGPPAATRSCDRRPPSHAHGGLVWGLFRFRQLNIYIYIYSLTHIKSNEWGWAHSFDLICVKYRFKFSKPRKSPH